MWIKIKPNDTLFFRSGRPFTMGGETFADSIFPPYPSTIFGAIRTFLIFHRGSLKDFYDGKYKDKDIGTKDDKGTIRIYGPILYNENGDVYLTPPFDLVEKKEETDKELYSLSLIDKPKIFYSDSRIIKEKILIFKSQGQVDEPKGWINGILLEKYLQGKNDSISCIEKDNLYQEERKIGIKRDRKTFTSEEGYLYRVPMIRLKHKYNKIGLIFKIEGVEDMPERGILQLGGEGKTVYFEKIEKIEDNPLDSLMNINFELKEGMFKLYLATPAIFDKGWLPSWIDESTYEGEKDGIKLKLISCAIGKFIRIGGWDIARNRPKPMYKAVPAGSVYYFKILDGNIDVEKIKKVFHFKNISDKNPEEGFGLSFIGGVI